MRENMLQTKIKITDLQNVVKANRDRHAELYEKAMVGYRKNLIKAFEEKLAAAKEGKEVDHHVKVRRPTNHLVDYDRVIAMLEYNTETHMVLNENQFAQYVRDDWSWKGTFINSCNPHGVTLTDIESSYLE
jgi:hypothetical protein